MADADRCYLNIPWKEWAKILESALKDVEGVDVSALRKMGEQEFDNYKAIERRVNDATCGGDCTCIAARYYGNDAGTIHLEKGATTAAFFALDPIFAYGGFTNSLTRIIVPEDGLYHLTQRVTGVLSNADPSTLLIQFDCFDFLDMTRMNGTSFVNDNFMTFNFVVDSQIVEMSAGQSVQPRVRMNAIPTLAGDAVDITESYFSMAKICGCNTGP